MGYNKILPLQHAYSDSTWASDRTDRCSIIGYSILLGSSPLTWKSKKQAAVSRALSTTFAGTVWLQWLLADFVISCDVATPLLCDNARAMQIANDPVKKKIEEGYSRVYKLFYIEKQINTSSICYNLTHYIVKYTL